MKGNVRGFDSRLKNMIMSCKDYPLITVLYPLLPNIILISWALGEIDHKVWYYTTVILKYSDSRSTIDL